MHGRTGSPRTSNRDALDGIASMLSTRDRLGRAARQPRLRVGLDLLAMTRESAEVGVFDRMHSPC